MAESLIHAILKGQYICFEQATLILQESSLQVLKKINNINSTCPTRSSGDLFTMYISHICSGNKISTLFLRSLDLLS